MDIPNNKGSMSESCSNLQVRGTGDDVTVFILASCKGKKSASLLVLDKHEQLPNRGGKWALILDKQK